MRHRGSGTWIVESQFIIGINSLVDFREYRILYSYSPTDETSETQGYEYHDLMKMLYIKFDEPEELDDQRSHHAKKQ